MDVIQFVVEEALIIVPALWIIGVFLKKSVLKDKWIVWILLVTGIGFSFGLLGLSVESLIQGILVSGAAVLGHQLIKQTLKEE